MTLLTAGRRQSRNLLTGGLDRARCARIEPPPVVVALTLLAALLRFWRLGAQGLWYDESYTLMLVRHPLGQMLGIIPHTESTPPVYYCVAWAWVRVFGRGAAGLRSLSAAAGTAMVPLAYASARDLLGSRRAGVVCAALLACNPLLWWYSQEARAYELLACLCALSLWAFARALRSPGRRALAVWAGSSALALGTHYFAGMLVIPEALWLLIVHRRNGRAWLSVAFVAACGLALLPLLLTQTGANHDSWIAHSSLSLRIAQIGPQLVLGTGTPWREVLKFTGFACVAVGLVLLGQAPGRVRRGAAVAAGLALAGVAIVAALIPLGFDEVLTRNLIELWLPLAILVAGGLACPRRLRRLGAAAAGGLCVIGLVAIVGVFSSPRLQRPDWPQLVRALGVRPPAGAGRLILVQRQRGLMPLEVYLPHLGWLNRPKRLSEVDVVAIPPLGGGGKLCWWGSECNLIPSPLQARYRLRGFRPVARLRAGPFLVLELRARRPTLVTRRELARALTVTHLPHDGLLFQR